MISLLVGSVYVCIVGLILDYEHRCTFFYTPRFGESGRAYRRGLREFDELVASGRSESGDGVLTSAAPPGETLVGLSRAQDGEVGFLVFPYSHRFFFFLSGPSCRYLHICQYLCVLTINN